MLAHVARVAQRAASAASGGADAECTIDVEVAGDHEIFTSPSEFAPQVTREALRGFRSIRITSVSGAARIAIRICWTRPWWKTGNGRDADVVVDVAAGDDPAAEAALEAVETALRRGGIGRSEAAQATLSFLTGTILAAAGIAGVAFAFYLSTATWDVPMWAYAMLAVIAFGAGFFVVAWAYPSIEVAPAGQSNRWKVARSFGTVVVTLVVSGVAKLLYG